MNVETKGSRELRGWLDERGHGSLARLAEWLGVDVTLVSYWKTGGRRPSAFSRSCLEVVTGIAPASWFTKEELIRIDGLRRFG